MLYPLEFPEKIIKQGLQNQEKSWKNREILSYFVHVGNRKFFGDLMSFSTTIQITCTVPWLWVKLKWSVKNTFLMTQRTLRKVKITRKFSEILRKFLTYFVHVGNRKFLGDLMSFSTTIQITRIWPWLWVKLKWSIKNTFLMTQRTPRKAKITRKFSKNLNFNLIFWFSLR